jgi:hypothetical protein
MEEGGIELQPLDHATTETEPAEVVLHLPAGTEDHKKARYKEKAEKKKKKKARNPIPFTFRGFLQLCLKNWGFLLFMGAFALVYLVCGIFLWDFTWAAWYSLIVLYFTFAFLIKNYWDPALTMLGSMSLLLAPKIITAREAASGFGDTLILALGALYVVAAAIENTGCLVFITKYVLRDTKSPRMALLRLMIPTSLVSGFVNNTPLVAMLIPAVEQWCKKSKISPSKLMIPLSYAAITGNFTVIATSPNLVVISLAQRLDPTLDFGFFEVTLPSFPRSPFFLLLHSFLPLHVSLFLFLSLFSEILSSKPGVIGLPIMVACWLYMGTIGSILLPNRKSAAVDYQENPKEYMISVVVQENSPVVGKSIKTAGLRHLEGLFLAEVPHSPFHFFQWYL